MDFTGKQERNGATGTSATQVPNPGPDFTRVIAAAFAQATADSAYQMPVGDGRVTDPTVVDWEIKVTGHDQSGEA